MSSKQQRNICSKQDDHLLREAAYCYYFLSKPSRFEQECIAAKADPSLQPTKEATLRFYRALDCYLRDRKL